MATVSSSLAYGILRIILQSFVLTSLLKPACYINTRHDYLKQPKNPPSTRLSFLKDRYQSSSIEKNLFVTMPAVSNSVALVEPDPQRATTIGLTRYTLPAVQ